MKHNWEYKRLGDMCSLKSGGFISSTELNDNYVFPCFGGNGIRGYIQKYSHDGDYIIIGRVGALCGNIKHFNGKFYATEHAIVVTPLTPYIARWLYYSLSNLNLRKYAKGAAQPVISVGTLNNLPINVPPMKVQERIVAELDKINEVIADCRELLRTLDSLAQSLFYDYFGDPVTNPKEFNKLFLESICTVTSSNRIFADEYCEHGIPFYRGKEISELSRGEKISTEFFISKDRYNILKSNDNVPKVNDMLITAVGTIGNIWVVNTTSPFYFKDGNIIWLRNINSSLINSLYFQYSLKCIIKSEKDKMVNGAAYKALTIQTLKKANLIIPPLQLQEEFAARIEQIEEQKKAVEETISTLQTLLDSRMDYWFN